MAENNIINIAADQKSFSIKVKAIPTTGFVWSIKTYDKELFKFEGSKYLKPKNEKLIGAPLQEIFTFKILKPFVKKQAITLKLMRSWETKEANSQVFIIKYNDS